MPFSPPGSKQPPPPSAGVGKPLSSPPLVRTSEPPLPATSKPLSIPPPVRTTEPPAAGTNRMAPERPAQPPEDRRADRARQLFKHLSEAAVDLNAVSDQMNKPILVWEAALKKLNLGLGAWVELSGAEGNGYWWDRGVGYTKLKDRWAISLRTREGWEGAAERDSEEVWAFNEAPRWLRIEAMAKLPDLLEALLKQATDTTQAIKKKIAIANDLAEAIGNIADDDEKELEF
jgi:hypothetical protein